eukprot:scaffold80478_cov18-Tisochrysis_lutea.AAC.1
MHAWAVTVYLLHSFSTLALPALHTRNPGPDKEKEGLTPIGLLLLPSKTSNIIPRCLQDAPTSGSAAAAAATGAAGAAGATV